VLLVRKHWQAVIWRVSHTDPDSHFHLYITMRSHPSTVLFDTKFRMHREMYISWYAENCYEWQVQVHAMSSSYTSTSVPLCAVTHPPCSLTQSLGSILNCIAAGDKRDSMLKYVILGGGWDKPLTPWHQMRIRDTGVYGEASAGRDRQKSLQPTLPQRSDVHHMYATTDGKHTGLCGDKPTNNYLDYCSKWWAAIAQSVQRLATDWTVRASNPGLGGEIFRNRPDRPWGAPSLLYNRCKVFSGVKRPGREQNKYCEQVYTINQQMH
jgi:hypothetical protein